MYMHTEKLLAFVTACIYCVRFYEIFINLVLQPTQYPWKHIMCKLLKINKCNCYLQKMVL